MKKIVLLTPLLFLSKLSSAQCVDDSICVHFENPDLNIDTTINMKVYDILGDEFYNFINNYDSDSLMNYKGYVILKYKDDIEKVKIYD